MPYYVKFNSLTKFAWTKIMEAEGVCSNPGGDQSRILSVWPNKQSVTFTIKCDYRPN